jgi:hypothetical protein
MLHIFKNYLIFFALTDFFIFFPLHADLDVERFFTNVYENKLWWSGESCSGPGSNMHQSKLIREYLPILIHEFDIKSILDIPCGDFHWMKQVPLGIPYIGADIVTKLILDNNALYKNENRVFIKLDIISDEIPCVDLVFCRDCLVHLSNEHVWQALHKIKKSGSKYLLTTCHRGTTRNEDIADGSWRPLNLMALPFNFKEPLLKITEVEEGKSMYLWKLYDLDI